MGLASRIAAGKASQEAGQAAAPQSRPPAPPPKTQPREPRPPAPPRVPDAEAHQEPAPEPAPESEGEPDEEIRTEAPEQTSAAVPRLVESPPARPEEETRDEAPEAEVVAASPEDEFAEIKGVLHRKLIAKMGTELGDAEISDQELDRQVRRALREVYTEEGLALPRRVRTRILDEVADDILGFGPLEPLLADEDVTEIMVNGPKQVYMEKSGKIVKSDVVFGEESHLRRVIDKIVGGVGRRVDESSPMVDARLLDGSRVNAVIPPLAIDGSSLTIRKFAKDPLTVVDLVRFGTFTPTLATLLEACVRGRLNVLISGGTGTGKTTTLNVLSSFIPSDERIVTIEDAAELQMHQDHVVRLESRPPNIEGRGQVTIRDLVRNSLRMRPDRIVIGEVRDAAALDMLQAMNTGHDGSIATAHANTPRDALSRLETMVLMAGMDLPVKAIREQIASALDLVVQQSRLRDGSRRITHVSEVLGMEGDIITLQDAFLYDYSMGFDARGRSLGVLKPTGLKPRFVDRLEAHNVHVDPSVFKV